MPAHRTSAVLKLLSGSAAHNPGRYRDESKVSPRDPRPALPPGALDAVPQAVRDRYRWLIAEFCLPVAHGRPDGLAILTLAETMVERDKSAAKVAEHGQLMKHPRTGKPMVQPYFSALMQLNESVRRQMNELGFTPTSRLRHAPPGAPTMSDPAGWDGID
jgi:hypothetical protein